MTISPFYHSSANEITQPNSYSACSHYLTRRWKRELGPTGYAILTSCRDRCFYNRKTGELRDVIQVPVTEIADECGISEKTVRRELAANKALQKFVRVQREPVPDVRRGGWRWGPSTFQVAMDDPIHPDDEQELIEIVRRKALEAEKTPEDPLARARRLATASQQTAAPEQKRAPGQSPKLTPGQSDRTQNEPPQRSVNLSGRRDNLTGQSDKLSTTPGQIDRTLKSLDSPLPENTFPDAAVAAPEFFASLFAGEEPKPVPEPETPAVPVFADLAAAEQALWLDRAEAELRENFGLAVWLKTKEKTKATIRAQRAANLHRRCEATSPASSQVVHVPASPPAGSAAA